MTLVLTPPLVACSQTAEKVVERLAGNAINGEVDIDEGNKIVVGENAALPADWPLPVPGSGTLTMATVQSDGTAYAMWQVVGMGVAVADSFGQILFDAGYSLDRDSNLDGAIMRDYSGLGKFVSVVAGESEGETTISVTGIPE